MSTLMKSLGAIVLLIGVGILVFFAFTGLRSNTLLGIGLLVVILGFCVHLLVNKKFQ